MPDNRSNLQIRQPGIAGYETADKEGYAEALASTSNQLKMKVTHGKNGTQTNKRLMATDGQDQLSLTEGSSAIKTGNMELQGSHENKWQTSQQNAGDHSEIEGEEGA